MAKQSKKLTREQKRVVTNHYMSVKKWRLIKETDFYLYLSNIDTGKKKIICKY